MRTTIPVVTSVGLPTDSAEDTEGRGENTEDIRENSVGVTAPEERSAGRWRSFRQRNHVLILQRVAFSQNLEDHVESILKRVASNAWPHREWSLPESDA